MDSQSQEKVIKAGFTIIRVDDYPSPRIKYKDEAHREWNTFEKYPTKAARDRAYEELRIQQFILVD